MSTVTLDEIVFDETIYPRAAWSQATVDRYADALRADEHFPAIILEAGTRRLLDGKHRVEAHRAVGRHFIAADFHEIPEGVPPVLYAASLSSRHGDPLIGEDKRRVAREIAESNPDYSMVLIAKFLGVQRQTVSRYIGDLIEHRREVRKAQATLLDRAGWSHRQIGEHLGVDHKTVGSDVTSNISPQSEDVLREAAKDLPIDAEPLIAAILAERESPTQTPEPAGSGPVPDLKARIRADLAEIGAEGTTQSAIRMGFRRGEVSDADLGDAIRELLTSGEVSIVGELQGMTLFALTELITADPARTPEPAAADPSAVAGSGINDRPVDEAAPASTTPTDPRAGESPAAGFAAGSGAGDRPWCGAARELGGQQPCPIEQPCPAGTCAIGDDAEPDEEEIGSEYRTNPAERISAVAEVAPEFVKPVEPEPAPKPTLTLVPDEDERRLAEQRDARALLSRGVNLLAPASWKEDHFQAWIKHMGGEDEELAALKERAAAAIAVLTRVIEEAGR